MQRREDGPGHEVLPPIRLLVCVTSLASVVTEENDYRTEQYPNDDVEAGHSWSNFAIDCSVQTLGDSSALKLQRLVLYSQTSHHYGGGIGAERYGHVRRTLEAALESGQPLQLVVDQERIKRRAAKGFGQSFWEEDRPADRYDYDDEDDTPDLSYLRGVVSSLANQPFTPQSSAVDLLYVGLEPQQPQ